MLIKQFELSTWEQAELKLYFSNMAHWEMNYGSSKDSNLSLLLERLETNVHNEIQHYLLLNDTL